MIGSNSNYNRFSLFKMSLCLSDVLTYRNGHGSWLTLTLFNSISPLAEEIDTLDTLAQQTKSYR